MKNRLHAVFLRPVLPAILAVACVLAAPITARAHARLVRSSPESGGETAKPPARIDLWFSELLDEGFNSISVYPAADAVSSARISLATGDPKIDAKDQTHLSISLKPLPPGEYLVEWRVLSKDGHSAPGHFKFKVSAGN